MQDQDSPRYRFINRRFLAGPNLIAKRSGLLASIEFAPAYAEFLGSSPDIKRLSGAIGCIRSAIRDAANAPAFEPDDLFQNTDTAAQLFVRLSDLTTAKAAVAPAPGRVLDADKKLHVFLPCEYPEIGVVASRFAAEAFVRALAEEEDSDHARQRLLQDAHVSARASLRRTWLNQSTLALVRAAHVRGIPYEVLPGSWRFAQLGEGARRKRIFETATEQTGLVAEILSRDK